MCLIVPPGPAPDPSAALATHTELVPSLVLRVLHAYEILWPGGLREARAPTLHMKH